MSLPETIDPRRPASPTSGRPALAAAILVMMGVAGQATLPAGFAQAPPRAGGEPAAARPGPVNPDRSAARSRLAVLRVGQGGAARTVVALARPTGPTALVDLKGTDQGILARELVRQAVLIAARDELGLSTRDEVLDDAPPAKSEGPAAEVVSFFPEGGTSRATIRRVPGGPIADLPGLAPGLEPGAVEFLPKLVERAEALSRTEFPAALKGLGLKGAPNKVRADAPLPAKVEGRLGGLGYVGNLAAVRDLHAAIRRDGESPARLAALARGYAMLGVLSEFHWHPAHKVYKARALLYAERLAARESGSAFALENRAFVRALVGRPGDALADLAAARKRAGDGSGATVPGRAGLIEAYCKHDPAGMKAGAGPHAPLAALLRLMDVDYPMGTGMALKAANDVLALAPDCYTAYNALGRHGGIATLHVATEAGPAMLTALLPVQLRALETLPAGVKGALDRKAGEIPLVEALAKAGAAGEDAGEPSWGALAHLVRETRFAQVAGRLIFMRDLWSVPVDDYWADVRPLVVGHHYFPYLECLTLPPQEALRLLNAFGGRVDPTELELSASYLLGTMLRSQVPGAAMVMKNALDHYDDCQHDLSARIEGINLEDRPKRARTLLAVSPRSPFAMATLVDSDWEGVRAQVPAWEAAGEAPALLGALGRRYTALKRYDEADRYLTRYIKRSPDHWAYQMLAANYKAQGKIDRWKATLDEFLAKVEDRGLDHPKVQVEIANYYMEQKRWAEARPYAEAAAESWAAWTMLCAARCAEGAGDWERAELWVRRTTERYPSGQWMRWFLFCKRTGHGDVEAARAWTEKYLTSAEGRPDLADPEMFGYFYWLSGSLKKAQEVFGKSYQGDHRIATGVNMALIADELGETARRDELLKEVNVTAAPFVEGAIYREFARAIADPNHPVDLKVVEATTAKFVEGARGNMNGRVGMFLMKHGKVEDARSYLKRCADGLAYEWLNVLAADRLRRLDAKKTP